MPTHTTSTMNMTMYSEFSAKKSVKIFSNVIEQYQTLSVEHAPVVATSNSTAL